LKGDDLQEQRGASSRPACHVRSGFGCTIADAVQAPVPLIVFEKHVVMTGKETALN